jgi:RNA polymerase sigma-70 factor (ECF subfamily)
MPTSVLAGETRDRSVEASFERHVMSTRKRIYMLAFRIVRNATDAEDITQETFMRAWAHYPAFDTSRSFGSWVTRIAMNLCIDYKRRMKYRPCSLDTAFVEEKQGDATMNEPADSANDPVLRLLASEIDQRLLDGIESLPQRHLQCILLLNAQRSYADIACILNCPLGTVRSRVHRARTKIRLSLEAEAGK